MTTLKHNTYTERRQAKCCSAHQDVWVVCSCGFQRNCGANDYAQSDTVLLGHRIEVLAAWAGIEFTNEPPSRSD